MRISVIIPALNEAAALPAALTSLRRQRPHEVLVVDGGSSDATRDLAAADAHVLTGVRGRAAQMNLGAKHATGDALLFLHADCTLDDGALAEAAQLLAR